jgi:hypothetical protein
MRKVNFQPEITTEKTLNLQQNFKFKFKCIRLLTFLQLLSIRIE